MNSAEQNSEPSRKYLESVDIPVEKYDLILLFPFALRCDQEDNLEAPRGATRLDKWVQSIVNDADDKHEAGKIWRPLDTPFPDHTDADKRIQQYAEWLFFHPFIRNFLYDSKHERKAALSENKYPSGKSVRILERQDLKPLNDSTYAKLAATWFDGASELAIRNVHLFIFDTGVGILSIELNGDKSQYRSSYYNYCLCKGFC